MANAETIRCYSLDEYLAMEPDGEVRHEFIDGEVFAMVGSSLAHTLIVANLVAALHAHLRGTPCRVIANDRKVLIAKANRVYYPDVLITCAAQGDSVDEYTGTQPTLIVEVLSPSTAAVDRKQKRLDYQKLDSLQDYVLVEQQRAEVQVYSRESTGSWSVATFNQDDLVKLPAVTAELPMALIYENVEIQ